ncbi:MAG: amidase [Ruminococcaceae bacterium]|nr:amidase [Oscillospiraceae bacterium]
MFATKEYNRMRALAYARRWAFGRNPLFNDYSPYGGDCTNFASQCLLAGSLVMNEIPTFGWYYKSDADRAPAWTGVEPLYDFLTGNTGAGPYGREVAEAEAQPGDIVQLGRAEDDFYHTLVVMETGESGITVAAHTNDAFLRPLSSYEYALSRFIHIEGVRFPIPDGTATFYAYLEGRALPPAVPVFMTEQG